MSVVDSGQYELPAPSAAFTLPENQQFVRTFRAPRVLAVYDRMLAFTHDEVPSMYELAREWAKNDPASVYRKHWEQQMKSASAAQAAPPAKKSRKRHVGGLASMPDGSVAAAVEADEAEAAPQPDRITQLPHTPLNLPPPAPHTEASSVRLEPTLSTASVEEILGRAGRSADSSVEASAASGAAAAAAPAAAAPAKQSKEEEDATRAAYLSEHLDYLRRLRAWRRQTHVHVQMRYRDRLAQLSLAVPAVEGMAGLTAAAAAGTAEEAGADGGDMEDAAPVVSVSDKPTEQPTISTPGHHSGGALRVGVGASAGNLNLTQSAQAARSLTEFASLFGGAGVSTPAAPSRTGSAASPGEAGERSRSVHAAIVSASAGASSVERERERGPSSGGSAGGSTAALFSISSPPPPQRRVLSRQGLNAEGSGGSGGLSGMPVDVASLLQNMSGQGSGSSSGGGTRVGIRVAMSPATDRAGSPVGFRGLAAVASPALPHLASVLNGISQHQ